VKQFLTIFREAAGKNTLSSFYEIPYMPVFHTISRVQYMPLNNGYLFIV